METTMTNHTLVDASALVGLYNPNDIHHARTKQVLQTIEEPLITDYLFDEMLGVMTRKASRKEAVQAGKSILGNGTQMATIGPVEFIQAWELFQHSKTLSFTDCTTIAVMRSLGITHIVTFDRAFDSIEGITVVN